MKKRKMKKREKRKKKKKSRLINQANTKSLVRDTQGNAKRQRPNASDSLFQIHLRHLQLSDDPVGFSAEIIALGQVTGTHHGFGAAERFGTVFDGFVVVFQLHGGHGDIFVESEKQLLLILFFLLALQIAFL